MGDTQIARARGIVWAETALETLSLDAAWPDDSRVLRALALMDVADLAGDRVELVTAWIEAAGERWRTSRVHQNAVPLASHY